MNPAFNIELKDDDADPAEVVTKALNEFQTSVDARLKDIETKSLNDNKLADRLDKIEAKMNRPGSSKNDNADAALETKAFGAYLRHGDRTDPLELKTLTVSSDPQGGYLAPAELSTEFIRNLVEFSPIRALATVRTTAAPSVSYPKRTGITNAKWKGETQAAEGSEPAFGQVEVTPREVNTYVDISNQLLADSAGVAQSEVQLGSRKISARKKVWRSSLASARSHRKASCRMPTLALPHPATRRPLAPIPPICSLIICTRCPPPIAVGERG